MALTVTQTKRNNVTGTKVTAYVTAAFDNSYPTGGEAFDATTYVKTPDEVRISAADELGYVVRYDATNKKLKVFEIPALDGNAAAAAPLAECANTRDLALLSVDLIISGGRA